MSYANICSHPRTQRIDSNFVRCLHCGQSIINQSKILRNKSRQDFTAEQPNFGRNFHRNFSNEIPESPSSVNKKPLYEYYTDKLGANRIIIDRQVLFDNDPPIYRVNVNGKVSNLTQTDIYQLLADVNAFRIDVDMFRQISGQY